MQRRPNPFIMLCGATVIATVILAAAFYAWLPSMAAIFVAIFGWFWLTQFAVSAWRWRTTRAQPLQPGETVECIASGQTNRSLMNSVVLTNQRLIAEPTAFAVFARARPAIDIPFEAIRRLERIDTPPKKAGSEPLVRLVIDTNDEQFFIRDRHLEDILELLPERTGLRLNTGKP